MNNWKYNDIDFSTFPYYGGNDLGVFLSPDGFSAKVWAPGASEVAFFVYRQSRGGKPVRVDFLVPGNDGCWTLSLKGNFKGLYYTFRVNNGVWLNETPGVDVRAVGTNGKRGLFFDPSETNPTGWENDFPLLLTDPVDAIIYELHVRDFSISPDSGMVNKGRFLAFTEEGTTGPGGVSTGIDHLKELGITHVHLLPVADYFTVNEDHPEDSYNWGYDPLNYNTPEGSYSSNPDSISRIIEFKQLVMALHGAGIGVILDVVYNHTGYTTRSWFNQTVPGYYYRQNRDGSFSDATGCGNEVASERAMVQKYIIDSLCYWAQEFHIDGFRFDLMGVLDLGTMNKIRMVLDELRPGIMLYGEGWTAGPSPMDEKYRAVKTNVAVLPGIGCFNDDFRDALKGNNFDGREKGFVSGKILHEEAVKFGIVAACRHPQIVYSYVGSSVFPWAAEPSQVITYVSCHDNYTLFDKLRMSNPDTDILTIRKMHKLAGALLLTSQGVSFLHAGIEFCRTKNGDHNSYRSPDSVNRIDWNRKKEFVSVYQYFCELVKLRKDVPALHMHSSDEIRQFLHFSPAYQIGVVAYTIDRFPGETRWDTMQIVFNATMDPVLIDLPEFGKWKVLAEESLIDINGIREIEDNQFVVPFISMSILVK